MMLVIEFPECLLFSIYEIMKYTMIFLIKIFGFHCFSKTYPTTRDVSVIRRILVNDYLIIFTSLTEI